MYIYEKKLMSEYKLLSPYHDKRDRILHSSLLPNVCRCCIPTLHMQHNLTTCQYMDLLRFNHYRQKHKKKRKFLEELKCLHSSVKRVRVLCERFTEEKSICNVLLKTEISIHSHRTFLNWHSGLLAVTRYNSHLQI